MYGDSVRKPQRQVRQIVSHDLLDLAAKRLPLLLIHFGANLVGQRIDTRIAIVPTISSIRGKALGRKDKLKDVGIVVRTDPAEQVELEIALDRIRQNGGEFQRT